MTQKSFKMLLIIVTALLLVVTIGLFFQLRTFRIQTDALNASRSEMDRLEAEKARILDSYADMRGQIDLRLGLGQDCQRFLNPDDPEISALVQEITGGYSETEFWRDYQKIYRWIMQNIEYSNDSPIPVLPESVNGALDWGKDFWRMPAETVRDGVGDCEDMASLLTSMLLNYNQRNFSVWIVGIRNFSPSPRAHVAVALPLQKNQLAIFDTATRYYTPFSKLGGFGSQDVPLAIDHWLDHLGDRVPDAQVYVAYSEDFYQEFSGNEEFMDWVSKLSIENTLLPQEEVTLNQDTISAW